MVIGSLSSKEIKVLQAAKIFRDVFTYEALSVASSAIDEKLEDLRIILARVESVHITAIREET